MSEDNSATRSSDAQGVSNGNILVADDDLITRTVIQNILHQAGYQADLVSNGQEAISALQARHYDLLVIDCSMPLMDGFAATRHIRNAASGQIDPAIPVIAVTGLTSRADQRRCLDAGMDACVSKPVDATTLIEAIGRYLGKGTAAKPALPQDEQPFADEFLETLITNFLEELPRTVAALQRAARQENLAGLKHLGHRLRGASGVLKFSTVSALSKALEDAGANGDAALAGKITADLIAELNALAAALTE
ncbi:MAG: response regulator [Lysobacterales bacterium]|jgi:protein-histidine pros-kinase